MKELTQSKILIVCYSYSGNTLALARAIRQRTGGGLTRVFPTQPYPTRFPELLAQVRRELKSRHYPRLLPLCEAPDGYDLIFAGTPQLVRHRRAAAGGLSAAARRAGGQDGAAVLQPLQRRGRRCGRRHPGALPPRPGGPGLCCHARRAESCRRAGCLAHSLRRAARHSGLNCFFERGRLP